RHRVVHEAAGDELAAAFVVDHLLAERLAEPLHRAAVDLAARDRRADDAADIVDRRIGDDSHAAGVGVDLDLADVARVRPGRPAGDGRRFEVDALARLP